MYNNSSGNAATPPPLGCGLSNGSGMGTQVSTMALNRSVYSAASHGQIVANIESNSGSSSQLRDWTNVHVEDMAFHSEGEEDLEQQHHHHQQHGFRSSSLEGTAGSSSNAMFRVHNQHQTPPPAIFLETRDILDEAHRHPFDYADQQQASGSGGGGRCKFNRQRHSMWVDNHCESSSNTSSNTNNQSDFRRYSDTRLVMEPDREVYQQQHQIFNVATALTPQMGYRGGEIGPGVGGVSTSIDIEAEPQITDIIFESADHGSSFDPLELNIQELLELDIRTNVRAAVAGGEAHKAETELFRSSQLSVNSDPQKYSNKRQSGENKGHQQQRRCDDRKQLLTPQSLPNLSASCENLLHQQHQQ